MQGYVMVNAAALMALHDALIESDNTEAYHVLRMMADADCKVFLRERDHFAQWKAIAEYSPPLPT